MHKILGCWLIIQLLLVASVAIGDVEKRGPDLPDTKFDFQTVVHDGSGTWVAAGRSGIAMKVADQNWRMAFRSPDGGWTSVATDRKGNWLAVGPGGVLERTSNGAWKASASLPGSGWRGVLRDASGVWLAWGSEGVFMRKPLGQWTQQAVHPEEIWTAAASDGKGNFVVGGLLRHVAYSFDGRPWRHFVGPEGSLWRGAAFDGLSTWSLVGKVGILTKTISADWVLNTEVGTDWLTVASDGRGLLRAAGYAGIAGKQGAGPWVKELSVPYKAFSAIGFDAAGNSIALGSGGCATRGTVDPAWNLGCSNYVNDRWDAVAHDEKDNWYAVGPGGMLHRSHTREWARVGVHPN